MWLLELNNRGAASCLNVLNRRRRSDVSLEYGAIGGGRRGELKELKGDRSRFIHPERFIHPGRVHVRAVGPSHRAGIQAGLIETALVLQCVEDAAFVGYQNR